MKKRHILLIIVAVIILLYLIFSIIPYLLKKNNIESIEIGKTTDQDIRSILGNPLSDSLIGNPIFNGEICDLIKLSDYNSGALYKETDYHFKVSSKDGLNKCFNNINTSLVKSCIYEPINPPLILFKWSKGYIIYFDERDIVCYVEKSIVK